MVPLSVGSMLLYADDRMLYRPIRTPDDYIQLQMDIDKLCVWTKNNLMQYNINKCKYMIISRRKQPYYPTLHSLLIMLPWIWSVSTNISVSCLHPPWTGLSMLPGYVRMQDNRLESCTESFMGTETLLL